MSLQNSAVDHAAPEKAGDAAVTAAVTRGVMRHLRQLGQSCITEFALPNGRRVDVAALDEAGRLTFVEVKVSEADYRGDHKWPEYLDYCDAFFFAVPASFPAVLLDAASAQPARTGAMLADGFGAEITRTAALTKLVAARRKAMTLRFARKAALRLQLQLDPNGETS